MDLTAQSSGPGGDARILFLSDSHLGLDLPSRPRVERRRRGHDFFDCYRAALAPALAGEVDAVVHGGDLFYRSRVPAWLVEEAVAPLRAIADRGVPVVIVPGNHERSRLPCPLLFAHPRILVFREPEVFVLDLRGLRVAFAGFPYVRAGVRPRMRELCVRTGYRSARADVRLLCMHHCVEGATCGPGSFTFRDGDDVVRATDLPHDVAAVLCGHVHRHQVLVRDLRCNPLPAPVLYSGSTERTSFAEMDETKGTLVLDVSTGGLVRWQRRPLPARPMRLRELHVAGAGARVVESLVCQALASVEPDAVLRLRLHGEPSPDAWPALSAPSLRALAPATMNVDVVRARAPAPWSRAGAVRPHS